MTKPRARIVIGTRGSPLALAQAELTRAALIADDPSLGEDGAIAIRVIKTTGDQVQDRPLAEIGGKGLFTKEIEEALLEGAIDLAVHSMKDVPTVLPDGLVIACHLPREDPRDALIGEGLADLDDLPHGAVVGTASLRRQAQLLARRPDVRVVPLRGNVGTRLQKLARGEVRATFLAMAGLRRLGVSDAPIRPITPEQMLPAVAQGAVGLEVRAADAALRERLARLDHAATTTCVIAERALLRVLDGSCRTPIAAHARLVEGGLELEGLVAQPDGSGLRRTRRAGPAGEAAAIGHDAGDELRAAADRG
jgi:hydroxymethylbilane synthase